MLSLAEADQLVTRHLGNSPRAAHSRFVGYLMQRLAAIFRADPETWQIVGLCHDLDYFDTASDRTQHGLVAVAWLGERISAEASDAIAAHDHRTGARADTRLAGMLKLADAVAVIDQRLGRNAFGADSTYVSLRERLADRSFLADIVERNVGRHGLSFAQIGDTLSSAPSQ